MEDAAIHDPPNTDRRALIDMKLGTRGPLATLVYDARPGDSSDKLSWREISLLVRDLTGIDVTSETLRAWFS